MENKLLSNDEAERAVLAALLLNNENYYRANGKLKVDVFRDEKNKALFLAIVSIIKKDKIADLITVTHFFLETKQNISWQPFEIVELSSSIATDVTFLQNVAIICDLHTRRKYWEFGQKLIMSGIDLSVSTDDIKLQLTNILNATDDKSGGILSMGDANNLLLKRIESNMKGIEKNSIHTGFRMIDDISGFQGTDLNIIAAESSQGKTTWLINILVNAAMAGFSSVVYSLEMNSMQLSARINSARCNLSSSTMQYKQLSKEQYLQVQIATSETSTLPIYFDDSSTSSFEDIVESIHSIARKGKVKIFAIDYLQILCSTGKITNQDMFLGEVTRTLKNLAKKYDVCIVALSQFKKNEDNPFPTLDRLRGSGQIREAADNVFFIYRPEVYGKTSYRDFPNIKNISGTAELIWAKGRNTGTRNCLVGFDAMSTKFYDREFSVMPQDDIRKARDKTDDLAFIPPEKGALPF